jgi:hypothetical protein
MASVLMIIPLDIYHGYTRGDPTRAAIILALENKDIAITLLYLSRFLSGWSAGKHDKNLTETYDQTISSFQYRAIVISKS